MTGQNAKIKKPKILSRQKVDFAKYLYLQNLFAIRYIVALLHIQKHSNFVKMHICMNKFSYISTVAVPVVTIGTTIPISWTSSGPDVKTYVVMWERDTSGECPDVDIGNDTITDGSTDYVIRELEEYSSYFIVVMAISGNRSAVSLKITGTTLEAGTDLSKRMIDMLSNIVLLYSSI